MVLLEAHTEATERTMGGWLLSGTSGAMPIAVVRSLIQDLKFGGRLPNRALLPSPSQSNRELRSSGNYLLHLTELRSSGNYLLHLDAESGNSSNLRSSDTV